MSPIVAFIAGSALSALVLLCVLWEVMRWARKPETAAHMLSGILHSMNQKAVGIVIERADGERQLVTFPQLERGLQRFLDAP